jgi:hypothetical protein
MPPANAQAKIGHTVAAPPAAQSVVSSLVVNITSGGGLMQTNFAEVLNSTLSVRNKISIPCAQGLEKQRGERKP